MNGSQNLDLLYSVIGNILSKNLYLHHDWLKKIDI